MEWSCLFETELLPQPRAVSVNAGVYQHSAIVEKRPIASLLTRKKRSLKGKSNLLSGEGAQGKKYGCPTNRQEARNTLMVASSGLHHRCLSWEQHVAQALDNTWQPTEEKWESYFQTQS